jgi:hypothetical protein
MDPTALGGPSSVVSDLLTFTATPQALVVQFISDTENQQIQLPTNATTFAETDQPIHGAALGSVPGLGTDVHVWVFSDADPVPEPAAIWLWLVGGLAVALLVHRRQGHYQIAAQ